MLDSTIVDPAAMAEITGYIKNTDVITGAAGIHYQLAASGDGYVTGNSLSAGFHHYSKLCNFPGY